MRSARCNCRFSCHVCPQTTHALPAMHAPPLPHMPLFHACPPAMHATPCHAPPRHACPPAMHAPLLCMPPLCHAHTPATHAPLPCMPPAKHAPPATHRPPATHPNHMPPCHACPHAMHAPPPVDRILDTQLWKYYLAATSLRAVITYGKGCSHYAFMCTFVSAFHSKFKLRWCWRMDCCNECKFTVFAFASSLTQA